MKYLEQALAIDPEGDSLHAPLATAYRGLGQLDKARPHFGSGRIATCAGLGDGHVRWLVLAAWSGGWAAWRRGGGLW